MLGFRSDLITYNKKKHIKKLTQVEIRSLSERFNFVSFDSQLSLFLICVRYKHENRLHLSSHSEDYANTIQQHVTLFR